MGAGSVGVFIVWLSVGLVALAVVGLWCVCGVFGAGWFLNLCLCSIRIVGHVVGGGWCCVACAVWVTCACACACACVRWSSVGGFGFCCGWALMFFEQIPLSTYRVLYCRTVRGGLCAAELHTCADTTTITSTYACPRRGPRAAARPKTCGPGAAAAPRRSSCSAARTRGSPPRPSSWPS